MFNKFIGVSLIQCNHLDCNEMVTMPRWKLLFKKLKNWIIFRTTWVLIYCPEHRELHTGGKHDDDDPDTNPGIQEKYNSDK